MNYYNVHLKTLENTLILAQYVGQQVLFGLEKYFTMRGSY